MNSDISKIAMLSMSITNSYKLYNKFHKIHDLKPYVSVILYRLHWLKKMTIKELCHQTSMPKQSISKGIHLLQAQGYLKLEQDPADNRVYYVWLTSAGEKYAQEKIGDMVEIEQAVAKDLGDENIAELSKLMQAWNQAFEAHLNQKMKEKE
ncbi:MAG: MarR family winged helix-turn-helix transcriptional regulator [Lactobacillus sp.]|nr:MarR family winged helix-turn-helix transcriptional regulator [Lactobacillus sp.]